MSGFLFAFIALLITGIGARDQLLVAALADRRGQRPAALLVGMASAGLTAGIAAGGAALVIPMLNGNARLFLAALALGLAGAEMLIARASPAPKEPTDSLGAFALVLFAQQLTDAARFVLFGIAVATGAILPAALGGAAGGAGVIAVGWIVRRARWRSASWRRCGAGWAASCWRWRWCWRCGRPGGYNRS